MKAWQAGIQRQNGFNAPTEDGVERHGEDDLTAGQPWWVHPRHGEMPSRPCGMLDTRAVLVNMLEKEPKDEG